VSAAFGQGLLIAFGGVLVAIAAVTLARRRLITLRYALGWLAIAVVTLVGAAAAPLVTPLAELFSMTATGVLLAGATALLVAIAIQLSISVSGLQAQVRELAEAHALLASRLDEFETRAPADA
jgi:Uncharacterized conserved protein (DUF2304)